MFNSNAYYTIVDLHNYKLHKKKKGDAKSLLCANVYDERLSRQWRKISFYTFPCDELLKKKWIHAIRRDEGPNFKVTKSTVVCSNHFRENNVKKTLAGKHVLKAGVVPSVFSWIRTSPRKRKQRKVRLCVSESHHVGELSDSHNTDEEGTVNVDFEAQQTQDLSTQTDFSAREADVLDAVTECNKKMEILKSKIEDLKQQQHDTQRKYDSLRSKLFSLDSLKAKNSGTAAFYTGFQDWDSFTAIYNYLDPGAQGENINYWLSGNTDINVVNSDDDDSDEVSLNKKGRA